MGRECRYGVVWWADQGSELFLGGEGQRVTQVAGSTEREVQCFDWVLRLR